MSKSNFNEPDYYQPAIIYNATIKVGFHSESLAYPFYSPSVFLTEKDAVNFLPIFAKGLLKSGDLPPDCVKSDGQLDSGKVKTAIYPIIVSEMELDAE